MFNFYLVVIISILIRIGISFIIIYKDALFLYTYPSDLIPYYYLSDVVLTFLFSWILYPYSLKGYKYFNHFLIAGWIIVSFVGAFFLDYGYKFIPFIYCLHLFLVTPIVISPFFNIISSSFNIKNYNKLFTYFMAAGNVGSVIGFSLIAPLSLYFNPLFILQSGLFLITLSFLSLLFIKNEGPIYKGRESDALAEKKNLKGWKKIISENPLIYLIFSLVFFKEIILTFSSYTFNSYLSVDYSQEEISIFLGQMMLIISITSFIIEFFLIKILKYRYTLTLFFLFPNVIFLIGLFMISINYNLITVSLYFYFVRSVGNTFYNLGIEQVLSVLSNRVRYWARLNAVGVVASVGMFFTSYIILVVNLFNITEQAKLVVSSLVMILFSLPACYLSTKVNRFYKSSLINFIGANRFIRFSESEEKSLLGLKIGGLNSLNMDFNLYLYNKSFKTNQLLKNLENKNKIAVIHTINMLSQMQVELPTEKLIENMEKEEDPDVIWSYIKLLLKSSSSEIKVLASEWKKSSSDLKRLYALILEKQDKQNEQSTKKFIHQCIHSSDRKLRKSCSQILGILDFEESGNFLIELLDDLDDEVIISTIESISKKRVLSAVPKLILFLESHQFSFFAKNALISLGEPVLPIIRKEVNLKNSSQTKIFIQILSSIEGDTAEQIISEIINKCKDVTTLTTISFTLVSSIEISRSISFHNFIYGLIFKEFESRMKYQIALSGLHEEFLKTEISILLRLASIRCLCWMLIYMDCIFAKNLISDLYYNFSVHKALSKENHILEFINADAKDFGIKRVIDEWDKVPKKAFYPNFQQSELKQILKENNLLKQVMDYIQIRKEKLMRHSDDLLEKVMALRVVEIFNDVSITALYGLAQECQWKAVEKEDEIFKIGDESNGIYIIVIGKISFRTSQGHLLKASSNQLFGELGVITSKPRLSTAIAEEDSMLLYIETSAFNDFITYYPEILRAMVNKIIEYVQHNVDKIESLYAMFESTEKLPASEDRST